MSLIATGEKYLGKIQRKLKKQIYCKSKCPLGLEKKKLDDFLFNVQSTIGSIIYFW